MPCSKGIRKYSREKTLSFRIICRGCHSVQVSEIFVTNIYAFRCAVKRPLLKKEFVNHDIFEGTFRYLKVVLSRIQVVRTIFNYS